MIVPTLCSERYLTPLGRVASNESFEYDICYMKVKDLVDHL